MSAYYNDDDPFVCAWLRELIKAGLIAPGEVDERSIEDVQADDLRGFTQCHFFAGIGVWSYALRAAGWPDDLECWTGSCPCQSFSASGKGEGFSDKRHLWPAWFRLISERCPHTIFGEQVASKDGLAWLDVVSADLEGKGYAIGATDLCAAGFGAPHIRQRLYFVAHAAGVRHQRQSNGQSAGIQREGMGTRESWEQLSDLRPTLSSMAQPGSEQDESATTGRLHANIGGSSELGQPHGAGSLAGREASKAVGHGCPIISTGGASGMADTQDTNRRRAGNTGNGRRRASRVGGSGFTDGFWRDAEWLYCRDGKYRPVEPGTFPLAHGATNRVGRLRGYGNALCAPVAQAFIEAYLEAA